MVQSKYWCFTFFDYESFELPEWEKRHLVTYLVYQREKCPTTGRMHLQGYVEMKDKERFSAMKKWLPKHVHWEKRKKSAEEAANYCKKEEGRPYGDYYEEGTISKPEPGKRNDLGEFMEAVRAGNSKRQLVEEYPEVCAKYPRFVTEYIRMTKDDNVERLMEYTPRYNWQKEVLEILQCPADDRTIIWVYDPFGNSGKTYLSRHLVDAHGAFYTNGGKGADICFQYEYQKIVIFDYVRDSADFVNYGVIEQLKNGILTSSKYESCTKRFNHPHVIVFANFQCAQGKFSRDRLKVIELDSKHESL